MNQPVARPRAPVAVLAGLVHRHGIAAWVNAGLHYFAPAWTLVGWLLFGPRPRLDWATIGWAFVWPLLWICYTFAHGAATGTRTRSSTRTCTATGSPFATRLWCSSLR